MGFSRREVVGGRLGRAGLMGRGGMGTVQNAERGTARPPRRRPASARYRRMPHLSSAVAARGLGPSVPTERKILLMKKLVIVVVSILLVLILLPIGALTAVVLTKPAVAKAPDLTVAATPELVARGK